MTFTVLIDMAGLRAQLADFGDYLKAEAALDGAAAMAKVIYDEARIHAPISEKAHFFYGRNSRATGNRYLFEPGTLRDAIYRVYSPEKSGGTLKLYRVSWNHLKVPYGHMVEFGTSRAVAHPFIGAASASIPDAIRAGQAKIGQRVAEFGGIR